MNESAADGIIDAEASDDQLIVVLAGPNGSGKTTFYETYLVESGLRFVNADLVGEQLGLTGYDAAVEAEKIREELVDQGTSFCMETVFSDPEGQKVAFLERAQRQGYTIVLVFICIESEDLCRARVMQRVDNGGHDVPDDKIVSRYVRSLGNLSSAARFVDRAYLYDNSSVDEPYRLVAEIRHGQTVRVNPPVPGWACSVDKYLED